jgi:hypothetical protein
MISPIEIIDQAECISIYCSNLILEKYQLNHQAPLFNLSQAWCDRVEILAYICPKTNRERCGATIMI